MPKQEQVPEQAWNVGQNMYQKPMPKQDKGVG